MSIFTQGLTFINKSLRTLKPQRAMSGIDSSFINCARKHIQELNNTVVSDALLDTFEFFSHKTGKNAKKALVQIDDIAHKFESCTDSSLLKDLIEDFEYLPKCTTKNNKIKRLAFIETLLDAINAADNHYCPLYSVKSKTSPISDKIINFILKLRKDIESKSLTMREMSLSKPQRIIRQAERNNHSAYVSKDFVQYNPLIEFLQDAPCTAESKNKLYRKVYLSRLMNQDFKKFCEKINDKFGVKVLDFNGFQYNYKLQYEIEKELEMFQKLTKTKGKMFDTLIFSNYEPNLMFGNAGGFCAGQKHIVIGPENHNIQTFRHELTHAVDKKLGLKTPKIKIEREQLVKDLKLGRTPDRQIKYAQTKLCEEKAVLMEYYTPGYSKETKKALVANGIPKGLLNHRNIDFYDYIITSDIWACASPEELKALKAIRHKLGGTIPSRLVEDINIYPTDVKNVLKKLKKKSNIDIDTLINLIKLEHKNEALKNELTRYNSIKAKLSDTQNEKHIMVIKELKEQICELEKLINLS